MGVSMKQCWAHCAERKAYFRLSEDNLLSTFNEVDNLTRILAIEVRGGVLETGGIAIRSGTRGGER